MARATTAAPVYFGSIEIGESDFRDGGMVANNPSLATLREIEGLHGPPALFVSIGTGLKVRDDRPNAASKAAGGNTRTPRRAGKIDDVKHKQFLRKHVELWGDWKNSMLDCEGDNGTNGWLRECDLMGLTEKDRYRLNVDGDLHTIPLDDWRPSETGQGTLRFIQEQTEAYLNKRTVIRDINNIANRVVEMRRQRAATEQWERFAVDVTYRCDSCGKKEYDTRAKLREHLQKGIEHRGEKVVDGKELELRLNATRTIHWRIGQGHSET